MKSYFTLQIGKEPSKIQSCLRIKALINEADGMAAHDKFAALTGDNFSLGLVIFAPTSRPEIILKHMQKELIDQTKPPFLAYNTLVNSDGFYAYANIKLEESGCPPEILGISLKNEISVSVDIQSEKTGQDLINFIQEEEKLDKNVAFSRASCSLLSDVRMQVGIEASPTSVEEVFNQLKDILPMPVDPVLGAQIIQNLELDLHLDNADELPKVFCNNHWAKHNIKEIIKAFMNDLEPIGGEQNHQALSEISDILESKSLFIHLFSKNWGHLMIDITAPGLFTFANDVNKYINSS